MKARDNNPLLCLLLCLLCACGQEEHSGPLPVEVSASITGSNAAPNTRTDPTYSVTTANYDRKNFEEGDVIKITKQGMAALYKKEGKYWRIYEGETPLTTNGGDVFTAVFPQNFTAIQPDQTTTGSFFNSNKLQATATSVNNHLAFGFTHAFAKITLVINYVPAKTPNKAIIEGTGMRGGSGTETVSFYRTSSAAESAKHSYVGIVKPGTYSTYTIKVTTGSGASEDTKSYKETVAARLTLQAGNNYQFTFTTSDELILTGVTVSDFDAQAEMDTGSAT